jgi:N-acetylmuramoyl-L-alanine amidase
LLEGTAPARQRESLMRSPWAWLCVALGVMWVVTARAAAPLPDRLTHLGRDWYDLKAWAATQQLALAWNAQTRVLTLTNHTTRLVLAVDSQQAVVNGVKVWLTQPVTARNAGWLIAVLDVEKVLHPLLRPLPRSARPLRTIVLDPGHGGSDSGHQTGALQEKRFTLLLAQQLRAKLRAAGYRVVMTRQRDVFLELPERTALANREKADLFVSLHFNAASDSAIRGAEVFCLTPNGAASTHAPRTEVLRETLPGHQDGARSLVLAYQVQKALIERAGLADRGVKHARFAVLRDLTMPGILVEAGFLSAPEEARKIADAKFREQLAEAIVAGIEQYRRLLAAPPVKSGPAR